MQYHEIPISSCIFVPLHFCPTSNWNACWSCLLVRRIAVFWSISLLKWIWVERHWGLTQHKALCPLNELNQLKSKKMCTNTKFNLRFKLSPALWIKYIILLEWVNLPVSYVLKVKERNRSGKNVTVKSLCRNQSSGFLYTARSFFNTYSVGLDRNIVNTDENGRGKEVSPLRRFEHAVGLLHHHNGPLTCKKGRRASSISSEKQ